MTEPKTLPGKTMSLYGVIYHDPATRDGCLGYRAKSPEEVKRFAERRA
jgi:hypothetical protein